LLKPCHRRRPHQHGGTSQGQFSEQLQQVPDHRGSEASNARTASSNVVQNLNPEFNAVRLQTNMESIHRMVPQDSPLIALAQHGVEAASNIVTAAPSTENHRGEPSSGNRSNDWAKQAQSEAATSANDNRCLADNDARRRITQNHRQWEYDRDCDDLHNVIDDRRRAKARNTPLSDDLAAHAGECHRGDNDLTLR
jgi:hypothetical protein